MTHTFACCPAPSYPSVPNSDNFICLLNIFWICLLLFLFHFSVLLLSNAVIKLSPPPPSLFKSFNGFIWITFYIHLSLISRPCMNWTLPVSPDSNFLTLFLIPYASATVHTFIVFGTLLLCTGLCKCCCLCLETLLSTTHLPDLSSCSTYTRKASRGLSLTRSIPLYFCVVLFTDVILLFLWVFDNFSIGL